MKVDENQEVMEKEIGKRRRRGRKRRRRTLPGAQFHSRVGGV
jgi:hypothetical protein